MEWLQHNFGYNFYQQSLKINENPTRMHKPLKINKNPGLQQNQDHCHTDHINIADNDKLCYNYKAPQLGTL